MSVLPALLVTIAIEVPFVALCYPRQRLKMALVALVANIVTNLFLNAGLPMIPVLRAHRIIIGEALALIGEAVAYALASRPRDWGRALVVSAIANAMSFELGGWVLSWVWR